MSSQYLDPPCRRQDCRVRQVEELVKKPEYIIFKAIKTNSNEIVILLMLYRTYYAYMVLPKYFQNLTFRNAEQIFSIQYFKNLKLSNFISNQLSF